MGSHICVLQEQFALSPGTMQWSLQKDELHRCQRVVAPRFLSDQSCARYRDADTLEDLWLTDDPAPLINQRNWTPEKLDKLLGRSQHCKFYSIFFQF